MVNKPPQAEYRGRDRVYGNETAGRSWLSVIVQYWSSGEAGGLCCERNRVEAVKEAAW